MRRLDLTELAENDLVEIWTYTGARNQRAADRLLDEIAEKIGLLLEMPEAGRTRDDLRPGLRSIAMKKYMIFYRFTAAALVIVRVLHCARDVSEKLLP